MTLQITSCQAPNVNYFGKALTEYIAKQAGISTQFNIEIPWQTRLQQIHTGQIQLGWICGYPYVQQADGVDQTLELLAVPIMAGVRYQNRPIYFSDVVVKADSPFFHLEEMGGSVWAYNEIGSQSGYHITRYKLALMGKNGDFFGKVVASGSHQDSLQLILNEQIDGAPIDSTVLETELRLNPALASQIRIIDTLGSNPIPPWVIHKSVSVPLRRMIRQLLTQMHLNPEGKAILDSAHQLRFETAVDANYDPIRQMLRRACRSTLIYS